MVTRADEGLRPYPPGLEPVDIQSYETETDISESKTPWKSPYESDTMEVRGSEQPQDKKVQDDSKKGHSVWSWVPEVVVDFFDWVKNALASDNEDLSSDGKKAGSDSITPRPDSPASRDHQRLLRAIQKSNEEQQDRLREEFSAERALAQLFRVSSELFNLFATLGAKEIERHVRLQMEARKEGQVLNEKERQVTKDRGIADTARHVLSIVTGIGVGALGITTGTLPIAIGAASIALYKIGRAGFHLLPKNVQKTISMESKGKSKRESNIRKFIRAGFAVLDMGSDVALAAATTLTGTANPLLMGLQAVNGATQTGIKGYYSKKGSELQAERSELSRKNKGAKRELAKASETSLGAEQELLRQLRTASQDQSKKTDTIREAARGMSR